MNHSTKPSIDNPVFELAEKLQKECHETVSEALRRSVRPYVTAQDWHNSWIFMKLAEYELRIKELENNSQTNTK